MFEKRRISQVVELSVTATDLLDRMHTERAAAERAEANLLALACAWADLHPAESIHDAAMLVPGGEVPFAVAGEGAPLVAEFCVAEYAAAIHVPTQIGRERLGEALELRHRLPRVWRRVQAADLPGWRARRIARATMWLSPEGAAHVDDEVAHVAHRVGPTALERLVEEATARFMPEVAEAEAQRATDGRHVSVHHAQVSFQGTSYVCAELDLADALDLEAAIARGAALLAAAGNTEHLDVRRSLALGVLARGEAPAVGREVVLHAHLTHGSDLARVQAAGTHLLTVEQVRAWCGRADTRVTVRPVLDVAEHLHVGAYEVPDRMREQALERDLTCVFPWCERIAAACDIDHVVPWDDGGPTASDNLAPLCRNHHRHKTHSGWTYTVLDPGHYLWRSPHGLVLVRDPSGTRDVTRAPPA